MKEKNKELNKTIDETKKAENKQTELKDEQLEHIAGGFPLPEPHIERDGKINTEIRI